MSGTINQTIIVCMLSMCIYVEKKNKAGRRGENIEK